MGAGTGQCVTELVPRPHRRRIFSPRRANSTIKSASPHRQFRPAGESSKCTSTSPSNFTFILLSLSRCCVSFSLQFARSAHVDRRTFKPRPHRRGFFCAFADFPSLSNWVMPMTLSAEFSFAAMRNRYRSVIPIADSDHSGQGFRFDTGHPFRSVSGHLIRGDFGQVG